MSLENTRFKNMQTDPFGDEEKKPQVQEQAQAPIQEQTKPQEQEPPKTTIDTLNSVAQLKKVYKNQTYSLSKRNIALIKVLSNLQKISQTNCLDNILDDYYKRANFDDEIIKMIDSTEKMI